MRQLIILMISTIFCLHSCEIGTNSSDTEETHFDFVLYDDLSLSDISDISEELEYNYQRIVDDLQVKNMPHVTIKIWANYDNFLETMENSLGVRYEGATGYIFGSSEIRLYYTAHISMATVHEFAHLVSMQVNSRIPNNPRWLWEAVALYETREFIDPKTLPYIVSSDYPTLSELSTDFNNSDHNIYAVGYVLLEYVVKTWGMDAVIMLIETNGNIDQPPMFGPLSKLGLFGLICI